MKRNPASRRIHRHAQILTGDDESTYVYSMVGLFKLPVPVTDVAARLRKIRMDGRRIAFTSDNDDLRALWETGLLSDEIVEQSEKAPPGEQLPDALLQIELQMEWCMDKRVAFCGNGKLTDFLQGAIDSLGVASVRHRFDSTATAYCDELDILPPDQFLERESILRSLGDLGISHFPECDIVVCVLAGIPFGAVQQVLSEAFRRKIPAIIVTARGPWLEIGPTTIESRQELLVSSRFGDSRRVDRRTIDRLWCDSGPDVSNIDLQLGASVLATALKSTLGGSLVQSIRRVWNGRVFEQDLRQFVHIPRATIEVGSSTDEATDIASITRFLRPDIVNDDALRCSISERLSKGELVRIEDAFDLRFAEEIHYRLSNSLDWRVFESYQPWFRFHQYNLYGNHAAELGACMAIFGSESTRAFMGKLANVVVDAPTEVSASWYVHGDHLTPHSDFTGGRRLAFLWHLSKDWDPTWGGEFYWCGTSKGFKPTFNTLYLFRTDSYSDHLVANVSPMALGKRLAVNGWWNSVAKVPKLDSEGTLSLGHGVQATDGASGK